jgi:superfamily I DNA/RNA helicase
MRASSASAVRSGSRGRGTEMDAEKAEERRVLFVALTRARR